jgi:hypothetical protein
VISIKRAIKKRLRIVIKDLRVHRDRVNKGKGNGKTFLWRFFIRCNVIDLGTIFSVSNQLMSGNKNCFVASRHETKNKGKISRKFGGGKGFLFGEIERWNLLLNEKRFMLVLGWIMTEVGKFWESWSCLEEKFWNSSKFAGVLNLE